MTRNLRSAAANSITTALSLTSLFVGLFLLSLVETGAHGAQTVVDYGCNKERIPENCFTDERHLNANGTRYFMFVTHTSCTWADARYFCTVCGGNLAVLEEGSITSDLSQWEKLLFLQRDRQQIEAWLGYKFDNKNHKFRMVLGQNGFTQPMTGPQAVLDAIDEECLLSSLDDSEAGGDPLQMNNCKNDLNEMYLYVKRQASSTDLLHFFGNRNGVSLPKHFMCEIPVEKPTTTEYSGKKYTLFQGYLRYYEINAEGILVIGDLVPQDELTTTTDSSVQDSRDDYRFWHVSIPSLCGLIVLFIIIFLICKVQRPHDF